MESKKEKSPWRIVGWVMLCVFVLGCAVLTTVALMSTRYSQAQAEDKTAIQPTSQTTLLAQTPAVPEEPDVWQVTVPTEPTVPTTPPPPVATNFVVDEVVVDSVPYPLMETPDITNPPDEDPDMQIQFSNGTVPDGPDRLAWICPLTFNGKSQLCLETEALTGDEDPYLASVRLEIRAGAGACSDFTDCFAELAKSSYCESFVSYLDTTSRALVANGYNSNGLSNLDSAKVVVRYWDGKVNNRQITIHDDCTVDIDQL